MLIDTGATENILRSDLWEELQKNGCRVQPVCLSATVASGGEADICGLTYPTIQIGSTSYRGAWYLMKGVPHDGIIGMRALRELDAEILPGQDKIIVKGKNVVDQPEVLELFSVAAINIPEEAEAEEDADPPELPPNNDDPHKDEEFHHPDLTEENKNEINEFLRNWKSSFSTSTGKTSVFEFKLYYDHTIPPIKQRCYPLSPAMEEKTHAEIDKLLAEGTIENSDSPWSSPAFLVPKKNGSYRLCVDFRAINKIIRKNSYPLPIMSNLIDKLKNAKYITSLDMDQAYHSIPVHEDSKDLTAFCVQGKGLFQYKYLPFGLSTAGSAYQACIEKVLQPVLYDTKKKFVVWAYLDDVCIASETYEDHIEAVNTVMKLLREANFKINWSKSKFFQMYTEILGHVCGQGTVQVSPKKIESIVNYPRPKSQKQLRSFLSLASYFRRFQKNLSEKCAPMTEMLQKGVKFVWTEERNKAFEEVKSCLISPPILSVPDFDLPFEVHSDASLGSVAGALMQQVNGEAKVIAYTSRMLNKAERNYTVTEKELLALLHCLFKFRAYLEGRPVVCYTDHSSLQWLLGLKSPTGRLARWAQKLSMFDLKIVYKKGKDNIVPDTLSRAFEEEEGDKDAAVATMSIPKMDLPTDWSKSTDPWYQKLKIDVENNPASFPSFSINQGIVFKAVKDKATDRLEKKAVVPTDERLKVLKYFHDSLCGGHLGIKKTTEKIQQTMYWPKLKKTVTDYIKNCKTCQMYKAPNTLPAGEMSDRELERMTPLSCFYGDVIGPLPRSKDGKKFIFVLVDSCSKFVIAEPLASATTESILKVLEKNLVLQFGPPKYLVLDNASIFKSKSFTEYCQNRGITVNYIAVYQPNLNMCERYNRSLKTALSCYAENNHQLWSQHLPYVVYAFRTAVNETTGFTPAKLLYGRDLRQIFSPPNQMMHVPFDPNLQHQTLTNNLDKIYDLAKEALNSSKKTQAARYNLRRRKLEFLPGTLVLRRNHPQSSAADNIAAKLMPKYIGPYVVESKESPTQYLIRPLNGTVCTRWHVSQLKLFTG